MTKVAFVGFGEINSPKELIDAKCAEALEQVKSLGFEVLTTETVTDDPANVDVERAIRELSSDSFDVLILCLAGWIPSHAVISITDKFKDKPMILWGLCGDMKNGRLVTAAPQAGTTALRGDGTSSVSILRGVLVDIYLLDPYFDLQSNMQE